MKIRELFEAPKPNIAKRATGTAIAPTSDKLVEILKINCKNNLAAIGAGKAPVLHRGMELKSNLLSDGGSCKYYVSAELTTPRKSLTGSSMVISWVSSDASWDNVPSRYFSTSCAVNASEGADFGEPHLIIPFDTVKPYAFTPVDFNYIATARGSIMHLGDVIGDVLRSLRWAAGRWAIRGAADDTISKYAKDPVFKKSISEIWTVEEIKQLSDIIDAAEEWRGTTTSKDDEYDDLRINLPEFYDDTGGKSLYKFLRTEVTPGKLGVKVVSSIANLRSIPDKSEVWFRGPYIALAVPPSRDHDPREFMAHLAELVKA